MTRQGIDLASSTTGHAAALRAAGVTFAMRYLSAGHPKDATSAEHADLRAHGIDLGLVWETYAGAFDRGFAGGVADARAARKEATAIGWPSDRPIYFAIDQGVSGASLRTAIAYIKGAASVLGKGGTGVYGGLAAVKGCLDAGACSWAWQTYGWSGGVWDSRAQVRQVKNGQHVAGLSVDLCVATHADFGQHPKPLAVVVPPAPAVKPAIVPPVIAPKPKPPVALFRPAPYPGHPFGPGSHGAPVKTVQAALGLPRTGVWGAKETSRVRRFILLRPLLWGRLRPRITAWIGPLTYSALSARAARAKA